jgi:hypothetical protein
MTATSDAILAIGPSAVALAAIGATTWQQRRGFGHQREMADLSDLRELFDDAALALHQASRAVHELELWLHHHGGTKETWNGDAHDIGETAGEALKSLRGRLGVRLEAGHGAVSAFESAHDATWDALDAASRLTWDSDTDRDAAEKAVLVCHDRLIAATDAFMRAASKTVGARLPS